MRIFFSPASSIQMLLSGLINLLNDPDLQEQNTSQAKPSSKTESHSAKTQFIKCQNTQDTNNQNQTASTQTTVKKHACSNYSVRQLENKTENQMQRIKDKLNIDIFRR